MKKLDGRVTKKTVGAAFILVFILGAAVLLFSLLNPGTHQVSFEDIDRSEGWTEIGNEVFVSTDTGGSVNQVLVVSEGRGALIDTGYAKDGALRVKDYLDRNNIVLDSIILTHLHSDHTANLVMFRNDAVKLFKPSDIGEGQEIAVGDKLLRIMKTDGHTPKNSHVSVELEKENILVAGDVVLTDGLPAAGGSVKELIATLERIDSKEYEIIIPGHGDIIESKLAVSRNMEYLKNASAKVEELIKSGGKLSEVESIRVNDCISDTGYMDIKVLDKVHRFNLSNIYMQIERELDN